MASRMRGHLEKPWLAYSRPCCCRCCRCWLYRCVTVWLWLCLCQWPSFFGCLCLCLCLCLCVSINRSPPRPTPRSHTSAASTGRPIVFHKPDAPRARQSQPPPLSHTSQRSGGGFYLATGHPFQRGDGLSVASVEEPSAGQGGFIIHEGNAQMPKWYRHQRTST